jgi:hypothetical protein
MLAKGRWDLIWRLKGYLKASNLLYMTKVNYFIAVCFNITDVSSLQMAITPKHVAAKFYILLTVHLDVILVNDQTDALFSMYLFHAPTCFEQQVLIIRRIKLCQYINWYNTL